MLFKSSKTNLNFREFHINTQKQQKSSPQIQVDSYKYILINLRRMEAFKKYTDIAFEIIRTNPLQLYNDFAKAVCNPAILGEILDEAMHSQELLFVVTEILIKKILSNQYLNPDEEISTPQNKAYQDKKNNLYRIISKLWKYLNELNLASYVYNSTVNAVAVCLKCISELPNTKQELRGQLQFICENFTASELFCCPIDSQVPEMVYVNGGVENLSRNYRTTVEILNSFLQYIINSTYIATYYQYRKNICNFRTMHLAFVLNYAIRTIKMIFNTYNKTQTKRQLWGTLHPLVNLLEKLAMYPYTLRIHENQCQDETHDNVSGLQTEIYFPTYFRGFLSDTGLMFDLTSYLTSLIKQSKNVEQVRQQLNLLLRIIGRCVSATDFLFYGDQQRISFRNVSIQMMINIIIQEKYFDQYYFQCLSKILIKILVVYKNEDYGDNNKVFFYETLCNFLKNAIVSVNYRIEDGSRTQIRLIFDILGTMLISQENTIILDSVERESQEILRLYFERLTNNEENTRMMAQFGESNFQETQCFEEIFVKIPQIFKIQLDQNLRYLNELNLSALNPHSLNIWLHLCGLLLPDHDTSQEQSQVVLKFFNAAINARSIASLHFINTLLLEILAEIEDGVSTTYLWKFMENSLNMNFEAFLTEIIKYTVNILTIPNYPLIQNGLQLFKNMFTKLCKYQHKSFHKYFSIVEQVSKQIDSTMLVHPDYVKLRINFFSVISLVWISQDQLTFVYKVLENIRNSLGNNGDLLHFMRYLIDITGILQPVESHKIFNVLVELILADLEYLLPYFLGSQEKITVAFKEEQFLRAFMRFLLQLVNDTAYRLTQQTHSDLGIRIEETFKPYLIAALEFDFPKKTVEIYQKFLKLNPLSDLLPFRKQFKQKNPNFYKYLLREYFENLFRLKTEDQFYFMYSLIEDNVELMTQWWQQIMMRDLRPQINVRTVVSARIWNTNRQKQNFGKMLYRISRYDSRYYEINEFNNQSTFAKWFVQNYQ